MSPGSKCQDYQLVIQFGPGNVITRKPIKRTRRSFDGCLTCKRRKIKCDETKERCKNCLRSNQRCFWGEKKFRLDSQTKKVSVPDVPTALIRLNKSPQVCVDDHSMMEKRPPMSLYSSNCLDETILDTMFLAHFTGSFLPTMAKPHFHQPCLQQTLIVSAAESSEALREIFIACGASLAALEDARCKAVARNRYTKALGKFLNLMKDGHFNGEEDWFFVAVQVLQTLCLRDSFSGSNATRCAFHFNAAYKVVAQRLFSERQQEKVVFSPLEKVMMENFIFNYSITIFFCEEAHIRQYIPDPYQFFSKANIILNHMSLSDGSPRISRVSMLSFQIAAKCSWLCRLRTYVSDSERRLHSELLLLAETLLFSLDSTDYENHPQQVQKTVYIAKVVLRTSMILLRKMICPTLKAASLQGLVIDIANDIRHSCNQRTIFPIWSLMIAASTSLDETCRRFFQERLEHLFGRSKSQIAKCVLLHLEGLWELYSGDEPFELLFESNVLDEICR